MTSTPTLSKQSRQPASLKQWATGEGRWAVAAAALAGIILLYCINQYGYFRDELYYLACANHPDWGYVDQPPLFVWYAWLIRHTLGDSLFALRIGPALGVVAASLMAGVLAREMGGGRRAQGLAALSIALAPVYLGLGHLFTMNAFDPPLWVALALITLRIAKTGNDKLWLWFGVVSGITVLNKYAVVFFVAGIVAGVLLTPLRHTLLRPWIWLAGVIAILISLPNFLWQAKHGFPFLILMENIRRSGRDTSFGPLGALWQQAFMMGVITAPLLLAGVIWYFTKSGKPYRVLGWAYVVTVAIIMALHGKNYYLAPIYPMVAAAGGIAIEQWLGRSRRFSWTIPAYACVIVLLLGLMLPIAVPVLPVETYIRYSKALGLEPPKFENQPQGRLPQLYADMFGWKEMAEKTARYYNSLPAEERARTGIVANNYGAAGAIDFWGPKLGLPPVMSGHQSYGIWGPHGFNGNEVLVLGERDPNGLARWCDSYSVVAQFDNPNARPDEQLPLYHCRGLKMSIVDNWEKIKHFD